MSILGAAAGTEPAHIGLEAQRSPDKAAIIEAVSGAVTTFAQLDQRSSRLARLWADRGLHTGDRLAVLMDNRAIYLEVAWASQRSGLITTPVNWHLTAAEARYVIEDSGSRALVTTSGLSALAVAAASGLDEAGIRLMVGGVGDGATDAGFEDYDAAMQRAPDDQEVETIEGGIMFYSSGTTGRPKGITRTLTGAPFGTRTGLDVLMEVAYGFGPDTRYLCPAPLYHAAPLGWSMGAQRLGGTVVVMDRFDPLVALSLIERYRITHIQMVPTMFVRMLKLSDEERARHDLSSLRFVIHAAAPCPVEVKERMLEWWGPIIHEYYAGSEGNGLCAIGPEDWLAHRGSVGRAMVGQVHIAEGDVELPAGEIGTVYFEGPASFSYHNDPAKTADAYNSWGWSTLGDLGSLDPDGFLYLSDRRVNLIITGGVNIYPQEIENVLTLHPEVNDVAVIGLPDDELGQVATAVVQPADPARAGADLEAELIAYCRVRLARFKCPRAVHFEEELPRLATGKLAKRLLLDRYLGHVEATAKPAQRLSGA